MQPSGFELRDDEVIDRVASGRGRRGCHRRFDRFERTKGPVSSR